jgi:hypothetical protein
MKQGGFGVYGGVLAVAAAIVCAFPASFANAAIEPGLQFGTNGMGAGQFVVPISVEVGPSGDIYVGDALNRRINQFSSDGTFIRAWGHDVIPANAETGFEKCTTAMGCKSGSNGGDAGEFASPDGIAAAANGDLYVADFSNNRVSQFTANGDFIRAWGRDVLPPDGGTAHEICTADPPGCQAGDVGSGLGDLTSPNGVAVRGGDVYVSETNGHRVSRFSTSGVPAGTFGSAGSAAGQLSGPRGVGILAGGNVVVGDDMNNRISEFTSGGTFVRAWGFDVTPPDDPTDVFETCDLGTGCQTGAPGGAAGQFGDGASGGASGVATDSAGNVFVADDDNNRIAQYTSAPIFTRAWGFNVDPAGGAGFEECTVATTCQQGAASAAAGGLANPTDLAVDSSGRILVVDFQTDRVVRDADPAPPTSPGPTDPGPTDPGPTDPGPTDPNPGPNVKPDNAFTIEKAKLNTKNGNAKLPVDVPGAGELKLEGKGVKPATKDAAGEGTTNLPVKPKGKTAEKLEDEGKAKVSVEVTFTPTGGDPKSQTKAVKLKLD